MFFKDFEDFWQQQGRLIGEFKNEDTQRAMKRLAKLAWSQSLLTHYKPSEDDEQKLVQE